MPDAKYIGSKIKKIRKELRLSRTEFAELLGISLSAVAMYETGERIPRDEIKYKISRLAGTSVDPIFFTEHAHEKRQQERD